MRSNLITLPISLVLLYTIAAHIELLAQDQLSEPESQAACPSREFYLDRTLVAPPVVVTSPDADPSLDEAGRIRFQSLSAVAKYFDHWLAEDQRLMARRELVATSLALAYGGSWMNKSPEHEEDRYRKQFNKKFWWTVFPVIRVARTRVFGFSSEFPAEPATVGQFQFVPGTVSGNNTTVFSLSWDVGRYILERPLVQDAVAKRLENLQKMKAAVLNSISEGYTSRRVAQLELRTRLLEGLSTSCDSPEHSRELIKSIDSLRTQLLKSNSLLDMLTDGRVTQVYREYAEFVTTR